MSLFPLNHSISSLNNDLKTGLPATDVAIIGGGISGYAMALGLHQNGIQTKIYERNKEDSSNVGFGFLLLKNGIDAMETLGLKAKLLKKSNSINFFKAINPQEDVIHTQTLESCLAISRKNMLEIFEEEFEKVNIHYNNSFSNIIFDEKKYIKSIEFENGSQVSANIFIASDGIKSRIREQLFPEKKLSSVGEREIVGIVHLPELKSEKNEFVKIIDASQGCAMGMIPILDNHYIWFLQFNYNLHPLSDTSPDILESFMKDRVKNYPERFRLAIDKTEFNKVFFWVSQRMDLLPAFHYDKIVLAGDAAHPLLAFTSQGVNSAIEDAICLSTLLAKNRVKKNPESIFKKYYNSRKETIQKYISEGDKLVHDFMTMNSIKNYRIPLAIH
ncbi:MAG: FAD-dependent monooxygenase [Burkholderiaceae bacterium]|nr:FAD-dependent monooxygenase [Burkholderiaceae bacterium]